MISEGKPYAIRLKSKGNYDNKEKFSDLRNRRSSMMR